MNKEDFGASGCLLLGLIEIAMALESLLGNGRSNECVSVSLQVL